MFIKEPNLSKPHSVLVAFIRQVKKNSPMSVLAAVFFFIAGVLLHKYGFLNFYNAKEWWLGKAEYTKKYLLSRNVKVETMFIDIKFKNFQKICQKREKALQNKYLVQSGNDFVPATIRCNDKIVNVQLRLKGDGSSHWAGDKWSFRIKIQGNDRLFGMKVFSIQHPLTRRGLHEWVFKKALEREGFIAMKYDFINVVLNGEKKGLFAVEEYPSREMLVHNKRREGVIIKFNDDLHFQEINNNPYEYAPIEESIRAYHASQVDAFEINAVMVDPVLRKQFEAAVSLLNGFRAGEFATSEVFDVDAMARFYALTDVFGALHGGGWGNIRFYYNPVTSRLEPIAYDSMAGEPIFFLQCNTPPSMWDGCYYNGDDYAYLNRLFSDYVFTEKCRMNYIINYFGQKDGNYKCGLCDICSDSKVNNVASVDYLEEIIMKTLHEMRRPIRKILLIKILKGNAEPMLFKNISYFGSCNHFSKDELERLIELFEIINKAYN